jgi:hypothetical protein
MRFDVYDADHPGWKKAFNRIPAENSDVYYLPEWYNAYRQHEQALPKCIVAELEGVLFVYPFFLKPIKGYDLDKTYYDIQTAYGYGGIITNQGIVPQQLIEKFNNQVNVWLSDNNVVAEFIRENPLLNDCRRDAEFIKVRTNIYIEPAPGYKLVEAKARQNVSKLNRTHEITAQVDDSFEFYGEFIRLYNLNAVRLEMESYYFFPDDYFNNIKLLLAENTRLIHIFYHDQIINSGLFFFYGNKGNLHLAGADYEFRHLKGNDYMYYHAALLSAELKLDMLCIGGGLSNDENDSLFRFKKKFSNNFKDVMIGKKIINPDIYNRLVDQWKFRYPHLAEKYSHFFLKYRLEE